MSLTTGMPLMVSSAFWAASCTVRLEAPALAASKSRMSATSWLPLTVIRVTAVSVPSVLLFSIR
ncbi:Uncharacterised protein [Bordetella pertussis]|nr:Uncharacterised protein [Bordetella pertussis]CPN93311.1 Uncharacterised protein [Bordetella pertussis]